MGKLSSLPMALTPTRITTTSSSSQLLGQQVRHATFIPRPRRPYTFTQLIQLSDGSTYTARTTSPQALYRPGKDTRNTLTWQPSEKSLRNVELDEAGKLAAFRERFGRGFDAAQANEVDGKEGEQSSAGQPQDDLASLIAGYASSQDANMMKDHVPKKAATGKKK